jgi:histidyl-tRNA synthetase
LYSRERIAGVGSSIGLDRLIAALETLGRLKPQNSYAKAVIACVREEDGGACQSLAALFREGGIPCEVFLEPRKLGQQFMAAEKKGARWVLIPGEKPLETLTLRELSTRTNREGLSPGEVLDIIRNTQ